MTRARDVASVLTAASTLATDTETAAAISTHAGLSDPHAGYVLESLIDAKGDLIVGSADNAVAKLTAGTDGYFLKSDSEATNGLAWASVPAGYSAPTIGSTSVASGATVTTIAGLTLTSPTITGTSKIQQIVEKVTVSATAANTAVNYDLITNGGILYYTSDATANWTLNVRGDGSTSLNSIMSTGQSVTIAFLVTNGSTAYYQSAFQVDGSAVTPKWQGGTAVSAGNTSSIDIYTITIIKTADATFTALAAQTKFA